MGRAGKWLQVQKPLENIMQVGETNGIFCYVFTQPYGWVVLFKEVETHINKLIPIITCLEIAC